MMSYGLRASILAALVLLAGPARPPAPGPLVLVPADATARYRVNAEDPGLGLRWVEADFDDADWPTGQFGIGMELGEHGGAEALLETEVPEGTRSVYTRTRFAVADPSTIENLFLGVDYDDGVVVWVNGVEIARSRSVRTRQPAWDDLPEAHESSNGGRPDFRPMLDVTKRGRPALVAGENVLAIAVWNHEPGSTDLVLVPTLVANQPLRTFLRRGPYLLRGTDTSVEVRWSTERPTDTRVDYGLAADALDRTVRSPRRTRDHRVRLVDLPPDTTIHYAVGASAALIAGGDEPFAFRTAPPTGARAPVRVWVIGDSGTGGYNAARTRNGYETYLNGRPTSFWLTLGDNAYRSGTDDEYQHAFFVMYADQLTRMPVWSTMGNHDGVRSFHPPVGPFYDIFDPPTHGEAGGLPSGDANHYAFDHANVHVVSLNSEIRDPAYRTKMLDWLRRDLTATRAEWIIAIWHHTPYSTGRHESDDDAEMVAIRERVLPVLDELGVDLALCGHAHAYQRSALMRGHYGPSETFSRAMVVDPGDGREEGTGPYHKSKDRGLGPGGMVLAVVGSTGEAVDMDLEYPAFPIRWTALGSMVLEIEGDRLDAKFINIKGQVRDHFTIVKDPVPAPRAADPGEPPPGDG